MSLIGAYMGSGKSFKTTIGVGKVIKGWDEGAHNCSPPFDRNRSHSSIHLGVPQMSLGEKAYLIITSDYVRFSQSVICNEVHDDVYL